MPSPSSQPAAESHLPAWFGDDTANESPRCAGPQPSSSLSGLSIYQDVVLTGTTVRTGVRDCRQRWDLMAGHLPRRGAVLDIGSNFGWFALEICREFPECVVASVEADERSASVQREVLESHDLTQTCLLTERAGAAMAQTFARAGQRFEAALCLSVLHWIPDHREFLTSLGQISSQLFIEHPDPREEGAGSAWIRADIGDIGPYLESLFPDRLCECLGRTSSHLTSDLPRELWRVGPAVAETNDTQPNDAASDGIAVEALAELSPAWPPRDWWLAGAARANADASSAGQLRLTSTGLACNPDITGKLSADQLRRKLARLPQAGIATRGAWWYRRLRSAAGGMLRAVGMRRTA